MRDLLRWIAAFESINALRRLILLILALAAFIVPIPLGAATYYVDKTNSRASNSNPGISPSSPWLTIGKCASTMGAGDTCNVLAGRYDERVSPSRSGSPRSQIVYSGSLGVAVRGFTINASYISIQGFEITSIRMSADFDRSINVGGGSATTGVLIYNNYIHDTSNVCWIINNSSLSTVRGNTAAYCGETNDIIGQNESRIVITKGVNDQIQFSVQGGPPETVTVPAGTYSNSGQFSSLAVTMGELGNTTSGNVLFNTGAYFDCGDHGNCSIGSATKGPTSTIVLQPVANSAYVAFGWSTGAGTMQGHASFGQGGATANTDLLIEGNTAGHVNEYVQAGLGDTRVVVRNNHWGPADPLNWNHIDGYFGGGGAKVLIEGNVSASNNNPDNRLALFQSANDQNMILRYNSTFQSLGGVDCTRSNSNGSTSPGLYFYNNTFYNNAPLIASGNSQITCLNTPNNFARNNIWYNSSVQSPYVYTTNIDKDYDLWCCGTGNPSETHGVANDPGFTNGPNGDFHLTPGSSAIAAGGALTAVASGDVGLGTTLVVNDVNPFQDGWAGTNPDCIAVTTTSSAVCIAAINYTTNTITLTSAISRSPGDPIWLYKKSDGIQVLYGSAPEIGAFPFMPGNAKPN